MSRIEQLFAAQARIRDAYRAGNIEAAIAMFDADVRPALDAVDHRVRSFARRLARSFLAMSEQK